MRKADDRSAKAIAAAGPFEARPRETINVEAVSGAAALIAAFLLMTAVVIVRAFAG